MVRIARVLKSNGTDGGILLGFCGDVEISDIVAEEPVYIFFDGLPAPFFFADIRARGSGKAMAHLVDVETLADAEELAGRDVFADWQDDGADAEDDLSFLAGWTLSGVGEIVGYVDIPGNPCIEVSASGGPVLVPVHEDLILSMDKEHKVLDMRLPDGLLDL